MTAQKSNMGNCHPSKIIKLLTVELYKIILLGYMCNFIFVPHFVKWKYLKLTAITGKVFTTFLTDR